MVASDEEIRARGWVFCALTIENATEADVQRWCAYHCIGVFKAFVDDSDLPQPPIVVAVQETKDRDALRDSFDVARMTFHQRYLDGVYSAYDLTS